MADTPPYYLRARSSGGRVDVTERAAPFSSIAGVEGRTWDTFAPANGRMVHRNLLVRAAATLGHAWVRQVQVVHDRRDRVVVKIAPVGTTPGADLARMRGSMSDILGPDTELEIRLAAGIELEASGKFRVARSLAVAR
jgi:hypothetical protein